MKFAIVVLLLAYHSYVEGIVRRGGVARVRRSAEPATSEESGLKITKKEGEVKDSGTENGNTETLELKSSYKKRKRTLEEAPEISDDETEFNGESYAKFGVGDMPIGTGAYYAGEVEDIDENVITMPIGTGAYPAREVEDTDEHVITMPIGTGAYPAKEVEDTDENVITMPIGTGAYPAREVEDTDENVITMPIGTGAYPAREVEDIDENVITMPIGTGADFAKEVEDTDENVITMPIGTGAYYAGDPEDLVEHLPIGKGAVPAQLQNPYRVMKSAGYDMKRFPPIDRRHHFEEQKPLKRSEEDEKALLHPCSSVHTAFARRREKQGCKGALAFVRKVCSDFFDCLFKRTSTDVNCEAKICEKFNIVEREEACYNDLFICV